VAEGVRPKILHSLHLLCDEGLLHISLHDSRASGPSCHPWNFPEAGKTNEGMGVVQKMWQGVRQQSISWAFSQSYKEELITYLQPQTGYCVVRASTYP